MNFNNDHQSLKIKGIGGIMGLKIKGLLLFAFVILFAYQNCAPIQKSQAFSYVEGMSNAEVLQHLKPSLVISDTRCILCHSTVRGNLISEFGSNYFKGSNNKLGIHNFDTQARYPYLDYIYGNMTDYASDNFLTLTNIEGHIYLPKVELTEDSKLKATQLLTRNSTHPLSEYFSNLNIDKSSSNQFLFKSEVQKKSINTLRDYVDAFLNYKTDDYKSFLNAFRKKSGYMNFGKLDAESTVFEFSKLKINAPLETEISRHLNGNSFSYVDKNNQKHKSISGIVDMGKYFTNNRILACEGDIILSKPLYLKNMVLDTKQGCRIYSTKSIFIEGQSESLTGIKYYNKTEKSNLQIASSKFIGLGLGKCSNSKYGSFSRLSSNGLLAQDLPARQVEGYFEDINAVVNNANVILMSDAGDCAGIASASRKVSFDRLLLTAPRVDSRYSGDYTGVIVANFALWSLGRFSFTYDKVFDSVSVLPLLSTSFIDVNNE
jgi:hypothetical protein